MRVYHMWGYMVLGNKTMNLANLSVFGLAQKNMEYLSAREKVIAGNIANASTPGYLPKDITKPEFSKHVVANLPMNTTNPKHLTGNSFKKEMQIYTPPVDSALTIDGNGVILEEQMNEASKTSSEYKKMITIYNKYKTLLQIANTKINT